MNNHTFVTIKSWQNLWDLFARQIDNPNQNVTPVNVKIRRESPLNFEVTFALTDLADTRSYRDVQLDACKDFDLIKKTDGKVEEYILYPNEVSTEEKTNT